LCRLPRFARSAICQKSVVLVRGIALFAKGSITCAFAWTVFTIVPIAGRPATFPWPAAVATEATSFRLRIDADRRLAAAVGGVARYLADAAGLENSAITRLQTSVVAACIEVFDHLVGAHPRITADLERFPDRIEVVLSHQGEALPAVG